MKKPYVSKKFQRWLESRADYQAARRLDQVSFCLDRNSLPASEDYVRSQLRRLGYGTVCRRDSRWLGVYLLESVYYFDQSEV